MSIPFSDDNAIAADKTAYLPNGASNAAAVEASMSNVTSYDRGLNGIMVDLLGGGSHAAIQTNFAANPNSITNDFTFRVGNNNSPNLWATNTILPNAVLVRTGMTGAANGAGTTSGSDRVELMWPDGAITGNWLEVIVKSTADTGLAANDTFFFGNEIGDTGFGDTSSFATVTSVDTTAAQSHGAALKANIPTANLYDFNKDGQVNSTDTTIAQGHGTTAKTGLNFLQLGTPGPFARRPATAARRPATGP